MRTADDLSDLELAAYADEHLVYELQMLLFAGRELAKSSCRGSMRSALIECFVIHLRNLIHFFFMSPTYKDDVAAIHFCANWKATIPTILENAKRRANKDLSHLTLNRRSGTPPDKPWDIAATFESVQDVAKAFVAKASPAKLGEGLRKWVSMSQREAVLPDGATMSSNATSSTIIGVNLQQT